MDENELREAFALFDKKGDSKIALGELGTVLRALGQNPTEADVKKIQQEIDPSGDKRLTFEEFFPYLGMVKSNPPPGKSDDFVEGLRVFDKESNGTINAAELRHVLTSLGEKLNDDDVDALLNNIQVNGDGSVNYADFVKLVMSG